MPFDVTTDKSTFSEKPLIPLDQKVTSGDWNDRKVLTNVNYQEFLDLKAQVDGGEEALPYIRTDVDTAIVSKGIYVFFGAVNRTFTISDAIVGLVEIRTVGAAEITLAGNINSAHMGVIYPGSASTRFRWDSVDLEYNF